MAYDAVYVVRAEVEAEVVHADFIAALNDDKAVPPVEKEGLWDKLAEAVDAEVSAAAAMIAAMGRPPLPASFLRHYARIAMCSLLYRRCGLSGERNPFEDREKAILDKIEAVADGTAKTGGFGHIALEDAQPNIFIEDGDAEASSSSASGTGDGFAKLKEEMESGEGMATATNLNTTIKRVNALWKALRKASGAVAAPALAVLLSVATARADGIVPETLGDMSPDTELYSATQTDELMGERDYAIGELRAATGVLAGSVATNAAAVEQLQGATLSISNEVSGLGTSVGSLFQDLEYSADRLDRRIGAAETNIATHVADGGNPHGVTAAQIGALTAETDPEWRAASNGVTSAIGEVSANLSAHASATNNPHRVTLEQLGLLDALSGVGLRLGVGDYGVLDLGNRFLFFEKGSGRFQFYSENDVEWAFIGPVTKDGVCVATTDDVAVVSADLSAHAADTNNPHGVTIAQLDADGAVRQYLFNHGLSTTNDPANQYASLDLVNHRFVLGEKFEGTFHLLGSAAGGDYEFCAPVEFSGGATLAGNRLATTVDVATVSADIAAHAGRTDNPHNVTAAQIGALTQETDSTALAAVNTASNALNSKFNSYLPKSGGTMTGALGVTASMTQGHGNTASGTDSSAIGTTTFAIGKASHAEGEGHLETLGFTITRQSGQTYRYNSSKPHGLKFGDVLRVNSTFARVTGINNQTNFSVNPSLGAVSGATVYRARGVAFGYRSHAEGAYTTASGDSSHAEGAYTTASGYRSHAEGAYTTASGYRSHAEGDSTTASGDRSHAEGAYTTASGDRSHAEGAYTTASGDRSHASGFECVSSNKISWTWNGHPSIVTNATTHTFSVTNGQTIVFSDIGYPQDMDLASLFGSDESTWESLDHVEVRGWFHEEDDGEGQFILEDGVWIETYNGDDVYDHEPQSYKFFACLFTFHFKDGHESDTITWTAQVGEYPVYGSHGDGTFNINPVGGLEGVFVGDTNLVEHIRALLVGWGVSIQE